MMDNSISPNWHDLIAVYKEIAPISATFLNTSSRGSVKNPWTWIKVLLYVSKIKHVRDNCSSLQRKLIHVEFIAIFLTKFQVLEIVCPDNNYEKIE